MRILELYHEYKPETFVGEPSITIRCKDSELSQIEYDIVCVLYDAMNIHPQFKDVQIKDRRI